jgi:RNA polymerase primary sigma factor
VPTASGQKEAAQRRLSRPFQLALRSGSVSTVRSLLALKPDLEACDEQGRTPLLIAISNGHVDCGVLLIEAGAELDARDASGRDVRDYLRLVDITSLPASLRRLLEPATGPSAAAQTLADEGLANPEPFGSTLTSSFDGSGDCWEEDVAAPSSGHDQDALAKVEQLQKLLTTHGAKAAGEDWADLEISLPTARRADQVFLLPSSVRVRVLRAAAQCELLGFAPVATLTEQVGKALGARAFAVFLKVLSDAGLTAFSQPDPWGDLDLSREAPISSTAQELCDELELRLAVSRSPSPFQRAIGSLPSLDRDREESLWSAADRAIEAALLAVARSPLASSMVLAAFGEIEAGTRKSASVTSLEVPDVMADMEADGPDDDSDPGCRLAEPLEMARESLRDWVCSSGEGGSSDARLRLDLLKRCQLTAEFLRGVGDELVGGNDGASGHAIVKGCDQATDAWNKIMLHHLPQLAAAASYRGYKLLDPEELVQEGCLGLFRAVERYDRTRGLRFWTYAVWWVRQSITRAIEDKGRIVRVPVYIGQKLAAYESYCQSFRQEHQRDPRAAEIAAALDINEALANRLADIPMELVSMDDRDSWGARDPAEGDPSTALEATALGAVLDELMTELEPKWQHILQLRFGLAGEIEHTLEEVGQIYGVTRERIRQIEAKALEKLRHPLRRQKLEGFLDR